MVYPLPSKVPANAVLELEPLFAIGVHLFAGVPLSVPFISTFSFLPQYQP